MGIAAILQSFAPPSVVVKTDEPPSVLHQTKWPCGFYAFGDVGHRAEHFNPAIVEAFGKTILVVRRFTGNWGQWGHNSLVMYDVVNETPVRKRAVRWTNSLKEDQFEDPRAFSFRGKLAISGCMYRRGGRFATQFLGSVEDSGFGPVIHHPVYGGNGPDVMSNKGNEKNWGWFEDDGKLMLLYHPGRSHRVVEFSKLKPGVEHTSESAFVQEWTERYGEPRGSTSPMLVGDEYWTFFHSSMGIKTARGPSRRYFMGAYSFASKPPFNVIKGTPEPILIGSYNDPRTGGAPPCVFPGGAILRDAEWTVAFGVNDCRCAWIKIPFLELADRMKEYAWTTTETPQ